MAATANQTIKAQEPRSRRGMPVAASTKLYQGTLAFINAAGYADDDTNSGANVLAGVVAEEADNGSGGNGDKNVEVYQRGMFYLPGSGFSQGDVGSLVYASDNFTVTTTATSNTLVGRIKEFVSATLVGVELEPTVDQ